MPRAKSATPKINRGRQAVVGRYFRGLPVVDAAEPLRVVLNAADIKSGRRLDPNSCAFVQACKRLFNSHATLFLRTTAYIELPDSRGRRFVNRFMISPAVRDAIIVFDKTGVAPEGGFILNPPKNSKKMESIAKWHRKHKSDLRNGNKKKGPSRGPSRSVATMLGVRDGRGKLGINYANLG